MVTGSSCLPPDGGDGHDDYHPAGLRAQPPLIAGQPCTASSGRANEVDARAGRIGRKLAYLLKAPGVPAGGVLGQAGRAGGDTPRGLQRIQQIARMRGGALQREPAGFQYWPGFTKG